MRVTNGVLLIAAAMLPVAGCDSKKPSGSASDAVAGGSGVGGMLGSGGQAGGPGTGGAPTAGGAGGGGGSGAAGTGAGGTPGTGGAGGTPGTGGAGGGAGTTGQAACPGSAPRLGAACSAGHCYYEDCAGAGRTAASCLDGHWVVETAACAVVPCGSVTCPAGQICLQREGGALMSECTPNACADGPISCDCLQSCTGTCSVTGSSTGGVKVLCDTCTDPRGCA